MRIRVARCVSAIMIEALLATTVAAGVAATTLAAATAPAMAAPARLDDYATQDAVLRWINLYRGKPDLWGVPAAVKALSRLGALKEPDRAAVYVGFVAGVIGSHPDEAEDLIIRMAAVPGEDQWLIVRAIAYSGLPDWKQLMRRVADRMPSRQVMIDKFLAGQLPTLDQLARERTASFMERMKSLANFGKTEAQNEVALELSPELLDTLWGVYFATGNYRPVSRIIDMLPLSRDDNKIERLTIGSMAKFTLASNASRDMPLLAMLKRAHPHQRPEVRPILNEVIEAAETVETARIRKQALAAIDDLKIKGPGYRRQVALWGKIGEGTLALGCIAAAATGHVELGLPCVVGGAVTSASLRTWDSVQ
jgi:hypothetical protein